MDKSLKFNEIIEAVSLFHDKFGIENHSHPCLLNTEEFKLRFKLMEEENLEYLEASENNDLIGIADALGDQLYILVGTILRHGLQHKIESVFKEIQRSNLSKLGLDGEPMYREDGKVLKGPHYFKPDIASILHDKKY
jgi:predicted HAD superfamily Cof-like phosphohydrolase